MYNYLMWVNRVNRVKKLDFCALRRAPALFVMGQIGKKARFSAGCVMLTKKRARIVALRRVARV